MPDDVKVIGTESANQVRIPVDAISIYFGTNALDSTSPYVISALSKSREDISSLACHDDWWKRETMSENLEKILLPYIPRLQL